jgi:hypothetical protein
LRRILLALALALVALALAVPTAALAGNGHGNGPKGDVIHLGKDVKVKAPKKKDAPAAAPTLTQAAMAAASALESPPLGTVKIWPVINLLTGGARLEQFTLRGVGDKIEVWVANDLSYPAGDCRNDGVRNVITDAQVQYLVGEFDGNMYPKMSAEFSTPPSREGDGALLYSLLPSVFPDGYFAGPGDKIVTLIANFRDENYNDIEFPSYVAGYHSSGINAYVNRNVMSIDSYDWLHRTGANPPHEPSTVLCENTPASPFRYEGIFAHEYQHLLEYWASPGESTWVNEGLADYAITVTGYGFPERTIDQLGWDSHIQTFLGWRTVATPFNLIPQPNGGPENSLTVWDDQGGLETLSDYGAAWTFMELLHTRFGPDFMTDFHNEDVNGLDGLQAVLDKYVTGTTTRELIRDWAAMVALDRAIDDGAKLRGGARESDFQADELYAAINWDNPQAYSTPGAPPNGSDYVRLRDAAGNPLAATDVTSIEFSAPEAHAAPAMEWTSVLEGADAVLAAGAAPDIDRSIVRAVEVPASGDRSLVFDTKYNIETGWDFAFVQVSTDEGLHWTSLGNADTTSEHDGGALGSIVAQLPGFNGVSDWKTTTFDLSPYAGQTILLRFRMMTDEFQLGNNADESGAGWWVDDVKVGGTLVSDGTLAGWSTPAPPIESFTLQLVGLDAKNDNGTTFVRVPLEDGRTASLSGGALRSLLGNHAGTVAAIVTYDESTESIASYAPYALTVNGVLQPGG